MNDRIFKGNIRELNGLRGIAILLVVVLHFWPGVETPRGGIFGRMAHLGWMGVDLFFVISGFLICGILLDTRQDVHFFKNFYARRSLRIFPLYYAFLALVFTIIPAAQAGAGYFDKAFIRESGSPLWYFFYAGNLRWAFTGIFPAYVLGPLWSLSIEEQFYIGFPLVVWVTGRERLWKVLWILVIIAPLFRLGSVLLFSSLTRMPYAGTLCRIDVISLGCLLALGFRMSRIKTDPKRVLQAAVVFLGAIMIMFMLGGMDPRTMACKTVGYSLTAFLSAAVVLGAVLYRDTSMTAFLRWKPLAYIGKICYGTYLLHLPTEVILLKLKHYAGIPISDDSFWLVLPKIAAAIAVASVSWRLFESPILRLKDAFRSEFHPQGEEQVVQAAI